MTRRFCMACDLTSYIRCYSRLSRTSSYITTRYYIGLLYRLIHSPFELNDFYICLASHLFDLVIFYNGVNNIQAGYIVFVFDTPVSVIAFR